MSADEKVERLREIVEEALLNVGGVIETANAAERRLKQQLEMLDYEDGD